MRVVLNPGHTDRLVVRTERDGREVIRKQYLDDAGEAIHQAMEALWTSPFGAGRRCPGLPKPLRYDRASRTLEMAVVDGPPLGARGAVGVLPVLLDDVTRLLADLHASGVRVDRRRTPDKLLRSLRRKLGNDPRDLIPRIAERAPSSESLCLNHGDFSPRNVLMAATGPTLIDFDRIQMAGPGRDVQYMAAWCWVTAVMNGTRTIRDAWDLGAAFEQAYLEARPEAARDIHGGRTFHRACGLVRIATEWSSMKTNPDAAALVLDQAEVLLHHATDADHPN